MTTDNSATDFANFGDIAQIEECGARRANQLLDAGYRLIGLGAKVWEQNRRQLPPDGRSGETFIKRDFRYVIGRTAAQPVFPAPVDWHQEREVRPA